MVAALDGQVDGLAEQRCDLGRAQPPLDQPTEGVLHVPVVEHLDRPAHGVGEGGRRPLGVLGNGEPAAESLTDVDAGQSFGEHLVGQEVALHELAEAAADLVLAARDDRRVRDRQPERMTEQRGDGEPVGERTDHRRFGARSHVADPGGAVVLVGAGDEVDDRGEHEEAGGERLHPPQIPLPSHVHRRKHRNGHDPDATFSRFGQPKRSDARPLR